MRILFGLFLILFPLTSPAQTIGDAIENAKDLVFGTECEQLVEEATNDLRITVYATRKGDWDNAFRYTELAFQEILLSQSFCEDDPEQLDKANQLMRDYDVIYQSIVCTFHVQETYSRLRLSDDIIRDINGDWNDALLHSSWASYHIDEAIKRCSYDADKMEALMEVREHTYNLAATIQDQVDSEKE